MQINRVQLLKNFKVHRTLAFGGMLLALLFGLATAAQSQTLFADDFEDGSADGWSTSG